MGATHADDVRDDGEGGGGEKAVARTKAVVRTKQVSFRMPIGTYESMLEVINRERAWSRVQYFIFEAIREKVDRHKAKAREEAARPLPAPAGENR